MLQRLKWWSSLKHYMRSVGMKENTLQSKGKGALKPKDLRWQWRIDGKGPWMAMTLQWQTPLGRKRPWMAKFPSMANTLRRQTQRPSKAKSELYEWNKQTSSFLTITRVLVRLGRRMLHYHWRHFEGKGKGALKPKALRWQRPFDGKRPIDGKLPLMAKASALEG
jgi:hypothetical protein